MDIETVAATTPDKIVTRAIDPAAGVTDEDADALATALKFEEPARGEAKSLFKTLYDAFVSKDMSLLEVNPLVVLKDGHVRVLDAKMSFDNNALFRHPDIQALRDETEEDPKEIEASKHDLAYVALDGTIGCMVNGAGLAMATMDIIKLYGGEPANFLDVGAAASSSTFLAASCVATPSRRGCSPR
jgi:succinyl-CoA synthetase beta subunit